MSPKPVEKSNNWRSSDGRPDNPDERFPPRAPQPGPPPSQDYDTLTAQHGKPDGAFAWQKKKAAVR